MFMQIAVIGVVLMLAYIWGSRGFFSALLHLACVLVAGAIAFAVWEPLAYFILGKAGSQWMIDMAWGVALALPFALMVAVLRMTIDKVVPLNADLDGASNLIGGIACGALAGTITAGIMVMSLSMIRVKQDFMGYQPIEYDNNGSLVRSGGLWFPADRITAGLYGYTSEASFRTGTPLKVWRPDVADDGQLMRTNFMEGRSRQTIKPNAFAVQGRYTVAAKASLPADELLKNSFSTKRQNVTLIDKTEVNAKQKGYHLEGFLLKFKSGAREKEGRVVIGNGQVRLVCRDAAEDEDGHSISLQPVALVSQADQKTPDRIDYGRWQYDSKDVYIASVGGGDDPPMAFEFMVPAGYHPLALYVKGVRVNVADMQPVKEFDTPTQRDAAVRNRSLVALAGGAGAQGGPTNRRQAVTINMSEQAAQNAPVRLFDGLIGSQIFSKDNLKSLQIDEDKKIVDGDASFTLDELQANRGIDRNLQVRQLAATEDTQIVQVDVSLNSQLSLVKNAAAANATGTPVLVDTLGQRYSAVGFMYKDTTTIRIRFTPGTPVQATSELPSGGPTQSRPDQTFVLVYRVTRNVELTSFAIGDTAVGEFSPKLRTRPR